MSEQIAFVSLAFGDHRYLDQLKRLVQSIDIVYPEANKFMFDNVFPPGSRPFGQSLYGFKPHLVQYAINNGFTRIAFFDPACILRDKLDYYQALSETLGVIAVRDDNKLDRFVYDKALNHFKVSRNDIKEWHLVGGSFYYFDFENALCRLIFDDWIQAERLGLFGSQQEQASGQLHGHRNDEAIMSLALYTNGSKPLSEDTRYRCDNCIVDKIHFK